MIKTRTLLTELHKLYTIKFLILCTTSYGKSGFNLYGGSVDFIEIADESIVNIYGGVIVDWIRVYATLNIFGGNFSPPTNIWDEGTVNVYYFSREYVGGAYSGILADGSSFLLSSTFNYYEVPEPATLLLLGLGAVTVRRKHS